jgi:hypothetical protein
MSKISCEQSSWFVFGLHVAWDHCPERTCDSTQDWKDGTNSPILRNPKIKDGRSTSALSKFNFGVARSEALRRAWRIRLEPRPSKTKTQGVPPNHPPNPKIKVG